MDLFLEKTEQKRGISKGFIAGVVIAAGLIAGAIWMLSFKPTIEEQTARMLDGSVREGSPEFAAITKDILISTDENTVESPTGMGTISMYIRGNIYNKGTRTINALEVNVAVITQKNEVIREKRTVVVPIQQKLLEPGQTIPITLQIDGFGHKDDRANIRWRVTAIKAVQ